MNSRLGQHALGMNLCVLEVFSGMFFTSWHADASMKIKVLYCGRPCIRLRCGEGWKNSEGNLFLIKSFHIQSFCISFSANTKFLSTFFCCNFIHQISVFFVNDASAKWMFLEECFMWSVNEKHKKKSFSTLFRCFEFLSSFLSQFLSLKFFFEHSLCGGTFYRKIMKKAMKAL